jgi:hypothetical protein
MKAPERLAAALFFTGWLFTTGLFAARIPAGSEMAVRLTVKVASEGKEQASVSAVVIAPVVADGSIVIAPGAELTGSVKLAKAATDKDAAQLQLVFTQLRRGTVHAAITAVVSGVDNARESVDAQGVIDGIVPNETLSARINQGIGKLEQNDRLAGLAGILQATKQGLKIEDANPNIDYDAGTEMTVRLTQALDWRDNAGAALTLAAFPNEAALPDLVNRQPFRTRTDQTERPSDMTNLMFLATEDELKRAFEKAGWSSAERLSTQSKLETARAIIEARGYKEGPMSILMLDGRPPDLSFQKGNNTFAQRHHLRIFRRPEMFDGKPVWVCSATHDVAIDYSDRDRTFIHRIDPDIDHERAKVVSDLLSNGAVRSLALVDRPDLPMNASNATGDPLRTDGRMAVLLLQ